MNGKMWVRENETKTKNKKKNDFWKLRKKWNGWTICSVTKFALKHSISKCKYAFLYFELSSLSWHMAKKYMNWHAFFWHRLHLFATDDFFWQFSKNSLWFFQKHNKTKTRMILYCEAIYSETRKQIDFLSHFWTAIVC